MARVAVSLVAVGSDIEREMGPAAGLQAESHVHQKTDGREAQPFDLLRLLSQGCTGIRTYAQLLCTARTGFQGPPTSALAA